MQGHVLIADWSVAYFVVIMNDVMNDNMAAFGPCRRSFGCVLLLDQIFRKQCTVRQYTTLIYLINLLWKLVLGSGLDSELHLGIAIPDLNFQSRDSGLSNSQSRDPGIPSGLA